MHASGEERDWIFGGTAQRLSILEGLNSGELKR
jgi:hypothetical protein